ncbi:unnamed protein product [Absidia cylindrospora]
MSFAATRLLTRRLATTARPLSLKPNSTQYTKPMWRSMATTVNQQQQNSAVTTITEDKEFGSSFEGEEETKLRNFTVNFGPQHPAAHGVLRLIWN